MPSFKSILSGVAALAAHAYAATDYGSEDEMGPAAFMWPADRVWSASMDNTAPCGSVASPGNRSEFPMSMLCYAFHFENRVADHEKPMQRLPWWLRMILMT